LSQCRFLTLLTLGKNESVQGHDAPYSKQYEAKPMWRTHVLFGGCHLHVGIGGYVVVGDVRFLDKPMESPRGTLVQNERIDQSKLESQQENDYAYHEVAVAIEIHDNLFRERAKNDGSIVFGTDPLSQRGFSSNW